MRVQQSRAVIHWNDGSVCSTEWQLDDGSQLTLDSMMNAMVALLSPRLGEKCDIKWEQRELESAAPVLAATTRSLAQTAEPAQSRARSLSAK